MLININNCNYGNKLTFCVLYICRNVLMKSIHCAVIASIMAVLSACSAPNYENVTDYSLCYKAAKFGDNRGGARFKEIKDRGLNCRKYAKKIDDQIDAEKLAKLRSRSNSRSGSRIYDELQEALSPNSTTNRLNKLESDLKWNCIKDGGVPVGNSCLLRK